MDTLSNHMGSVSVPFGWKRYIIDTSVVYISQSNATFWCLDEVSAYLQTEGTCKCGVECPLILKKVFNFDSKVLSKPYDVNQSNSDDMTKLCNHKRKIIALATYQNSSVLHRMNYVKSTTPVMVEMTKSDRLTPIIQPDASLASQLSPVQPDTVLSHRLSPIHPDTVLAHQLSPIVQPETSLANQLPPIIQPETVLAPQLPPILQQDSSLAPQLSPIIQPDTVLAPQLFHVINPIQFTPMTPNAVAVLQSNQTQETGATLFIPQFVQQQMAEQQMLLTTAAQVRSLGHQETIFPQVGSSFLSAIPVGTAFAMSPHQNLPCVKAKRKRPRKKKTGHSRHPHTIAAILREAEENGKRLKTESKTQGVQTSGNVEYEESSNP